MLIDQKLSKANFALPSTFSLITNPFPNYFPRLRADEFLLIENFSIFRKFSAIRKVLLHRGKFLETSTSLKIKFTDALEIVIFKQASEGEKPVPTSQVCCCLEQKSSWRNLIFHFSPSPSSSHKNKSLEKNFKDILFVFFACSRVAFCLKDY